MKLFCLMILLLTTTLHAGERAKLLQTELKGADRLELFEVMMGARKDAPPSFVVRGADKIAHFVEALDFDDTQNGFHCACRGDCQIVLYRGGKRIAALSHHHGHSLRWHGSKWKGDSFFTARAAKAWREWFKQNGELRFAKMHAEAVAEEKRQTTVHQKMMASFPEEAERIFEQANRKSRTFFPDDNENNGNKKLSTPAKKLISLFPDRKGLASSLANALGVLPISGDDLGSWTTSTSREQLILDCASTLMAEEISMLVSSNDKQVLAGTAKLFFFEGLYKQLPENQRGPAAAKLCRTVLQDDRCGNADIAVRKLGQFPCKESKFLLEMVAAGEIKTRETPSPLKDEPALRFASCIMLAKARSKKLGAILRELNQKPGLDKFDSNALKVARALTGERGVLTADVFNVDSYTIAFGALEALEKEGGRDAIDAVVKGGTTHSWAAVREEAVLVTERMTGKKWYKNQEHERAEWHGKDIREWWSKNRASHPEKK